MKKKALGRGLSALFDNNNQGKKNSLAPLPTENKELPSKQEGYRLLDIHLIQANPSQPRSYFDETKLKELASSIKNFGIIEPIIVNPKDGTGNQETYEVVAGERRLRASKLAGLTTIPAIIRTPNNDNLLELMLIENLQREDLTTLEEAQSYETIISKKNITQEQLANLIGKSRSYITNMMRILKAPESVKKQLAENLLSASQVRTLMGLPTTEITKLADRIVKEGISVRELEKIVNRSNVKPSKKSPSKKPETSKQDPNISEIEQLYRDRLKTKVTIYPLSNKKGKIEIEYYDYDELLAILAQIGNYK